MSISDERIKKLYYILQDSRCPAYFIDNAQMLALAEYLSDKVRVFTRCRDCGWLRKEPVLKNGYKPTGEIENICDYKYQFRNGLDRFYVLPVVLSDNNGCISGYERKSEVEE